MPCRENSAFEAIKKRYYMAINYLQIFTSVGLDQDTKALALFTASLLQLQENVRGKAVASPAGPKLPVKLFQGGLWRQPD
jgi:hypothetical protein